MLERSSAPRLPRQFSHSAAPKLWSPHAHWSCNKPAATEPVTKGRRVAAQRCVILFRIRPRTSQDGKMLISTLGKRLVNESCCSLEELIAGSMNSYYFLLFYQVLRPLALL